MEILLAIILGAAFGAVLQRIGATNPNHIIDMLKLTDMKLAKTILMAIGLASIIVFTVNAIAPQTVHFSVKAAYLGVLVGGMIFGIGFAVGGLCPGTSLASAAEGRKDAVFFVIGGLLGSWLFAIAYEHIKTTDIYRTSLGGKSALAEGVFRHGHEYNAIIGFMSGTVTAVVIGIIFIIIAAKLPNALRKED
ncbi:MAG: YeeE/YedE family protein [Thiotrichales bacterium]|nr:YeeE/YedE family protein [Thiotrichales bacterium]